jgi:hypothetical protein
MKDKTDLKSSTSAFVVSLAVHGAILLAVGGYVVFEGVIPNTPFVAVGGPVGMNDEEVLPEPESTPDSPDVPAVANDLTPSLEASGDASASTSEDILLFAGPNPTFTLPPAIGPASAIPTIGAGSGVQGNASTTAITPVSSTAVKTLFGSSEQMQSALKGQLYDLTKARDGQPLEGAARRRFEDIIQEFCEKNMNLAVLRDYYRARQVFYTSSFCIPASESDLAPKSFGVEGEIRSGSWLIVYTGTISPPKTGDYRFVGFGDDYLFVKLGNAIVLDGSGYVVGGRKLNSWIKTNPNERIIDYRAYGTWIRLEEGTTYPITVAYGDQGSRFSVILMVEEKGKKYATLRDEPILPLFLTQRPERGQLTPVQGADMEARSPIFKATPE